MPKAAGHCSRQNIITSASTVLPAILNVRLGALREQQQLREGCFLEMIKLDTSAGFGEIQLEKQGSERFNLKVNRGYFFGSTLGC